MSARRRNLKATLTPVNRKHRLRYTCLGSALLLALSASGANAATYSASSEAELIQAINNANANAGADTIRIGADIVLSSALPMITDALTLQAIGRQRAIVRDDSGSNACSTTATNAFRLLDASADLTLLNLKFSGGCNLLDFGGAVRVQHAALRLENSTVTGNQTFLDNPNYYYGLGGGGGVAVAYGSLTLVDSVVSGNAAHGNVANGGGAAAIISDLQVVRSTISENSTQGVGAYGGGIYVVGATVAIGDSVFADNHTNGYYANGGGLAGFDVASTIVTSQFTGNTISGYSNDRGGGINIVNPYGERTTTIDRCTISNNSIVTPDSAWGAGLRVGGGIVNISSSSVSNNRIDAGYKARGGAMWFEVVNATLTNTTISDNVISGTDVGGGGLAILSEAPRSMTLAVYNSTIAGNEANGGTGGGLWIKRETDDSVPPTAYFESTILAGNLGQDGLDAVAQVNNAPTVVAKHSLIQGTVNVGAGTFTPDATTSSLAGLDPLLLPLASNGGSTATQALGCGSPAINAGSNSSGLKWDQRGAGFPRKTGQSVDIGAVEARCQQ